MKIFVSKSASKQLLRIPYKIRIKIELQIERLGRNPFPARSKKLSGRPGYRIRIGDYRTIYFIDKRRRKIVILSVQHRKDAYRVK